MFFFKLKHRISTKYYNSTAQLIYTYLGQKIINFIQFIQLLKYIYKYSFNYTVIYIWNYPVHWTFAHTSFIHFLFSFVDVTLQLLYCFRKYAIPFIFIFQFITLVQWWRYIACGWQISINAQMYLFYSKQLYWFTGFPMSKSKHNRNN